MDIDGIRRAYALHAKRSTSIFARQQRQSALAEARSRADAEIAALSIEYAEQRRRWQADLDSGWDALRRNEPDAVLAALSRAFEDNEGTAAPVGVHGDEVSLAVIVPTDDVIPDRRPTTTAAGNLSLKKLTKRETADFYKLLVAGLVLVTLKECFAVAPGVRTARAVAVRRRSDADLPEVLLGATVERTSLTDAKWGSADAMSLLQHCASELVMRERGSTKALQPLEVSGHPDLERLVDAIAFDDGPETPVGGGWR